VADLYRGPFGSHPGGLRRVGSNVFFAADEGLHGREVWLITP